MEVLEKVWTYADLVREFPQETRVELINNEIYMPPAPNTEHQRISRKLLFNLSKFIEMSNYGELFYAPFDVILDKHTVVQPDIVFISQSNLQILTQRGCEGVPDLVVEIISPSTFHRDNVEKYQLYERFGVKEYWLVEPANQVIEVFKLEKGKYELYSFVSSELGEVAKSALLEGFEVKREEVFPKKT